MTIRQPTPSRTPASQDFVRIDREVVAALGGSLEAAALWDRIGYRAGPDGWYTPETQAALFEDAMLSTWKGKAALRLLREQGWLVTERLSTFDPRLRYQAVYPTSPGQVGIQLHEKQDSAATVKQDSNFTPSCKNSKNTPLPPQGEAVEELPLDLPSSRPLRAVPPPDCTDEWFAEWWAVYPRRVGRKAARTAYGHAVTAVGHEVLLAGLRAQLPMYAARPPDKIPHPTTWLNQGRWDDDVYVPAPEPVELPRVPDWVADL